MRVRILALSLTFLAPLVAEAQFETETQFGKNKVEWRKNELDFYQSPHFDIFTYLDLEDPVQRAYCEEVVNELEHAYEILSGALEHQFSSKVPVILYKTHNEFEATHIVPDFNPEGIAAFFEPLRNRLVLKMDFLEPLNKTVIAHELSHMFQFSIMGWGITSLISSQSSIPPLWVLEGGAEYLAGKCNPYTRDDIRLMEQRGIAANPEKDLPPLEILNMGGGNPYTLGAMVYLFLENRYGEDFVMKFQNRALREKGRNMMDLIEEMAGEEITPEIFDRLQRDFWRSQFAPKMAARPRPYEETENFKGRTLTPPEFPYPILSSVLSPDGTEFVGMSIQKNGLAIIKFPFRKQWEKKDIKEFVGPVRPLVKKGPEKPENMTPYWPPKHFESLVAQYLNTGPFNGVDLSWSHDGKRIAFFARHNRDHALFVIDANDRKILKSFDLPMDQAFSPAFDPSGKKIYFSAAHNVVRDIYAIDLETGEIENLTSDRAYDTAPAVSFDGKTLAYISFMGDFQKIFLLDLESGVREQLTFNRSNENSPSFSEDGKTLIYTSDEDERIWNIYTIDLETKLVRQWTNLYGGAFTPRFKGASKEEIYYTVFWQYDQYRIYIYPNFELYEAQLKKPIREFAMTDRKESTEWLFTSAETVDKKLDSNQILNQQPAPEKWRLNGNSAFAGYNTYWGMFGYTSLSVSNILNNRHHLFRFLSYGSSFTMFDYSYIDQRNRLDHGYSGYYRKIPLYYLYYSVSEYAPHQMILTQTMGEEIGFNLFAQYPIDKFHRFEMALRGRKREFDVYSPDPNLYPEAPPDDIQLYNMFRDATNTSLGFAGAYVRDTVLYSNSTQGPIHGDAVRLDLEVAPPMGQLAKHITFNADARKYIRLSGGSLLAMRTAGLWSTRESGDFMLMGGLSMIRAHEYGSLVGNQAFYASAELRFPFVDAVVFPHGIAIGPIRGFLFGDYGIARFDKEEFPAESASSLGIGLQFLPFNVVWARRSIDDFKNWAFDFYVSLNF